MAFALVARDPAHVPEDALDRVDAAVPSLTGAFSDASRGLVRLSPAGPARLLIPPADLAALGDAPASLARAYFSEPDAPRARFLVLLSFDVPVASPDCHCVAWHARARNPGPLGGAFDNTRAFGAPSDFIGVSALGTLDALADPQELALRFLHETAHAWCCRMPSGDPDAVLLDADGTHWRAASWNAGDPLAGDGGAGHARGGWRFSDLTLVAMGAMPAREAAPVRVAGREIDPLGLVARSLSPSS